MCYVVKPITNFYRVIQVQPTHLRVILDQVHLTILFLQVTQGPIHHMVPHHKGITLVCLLQVPMACILVNILHMQCRDKIQHHLVPKDLQVLASRDRRFQKICMLFKRRLIRWKRKECKTIKDTLN